MWAIGTDSFSRRRIDGTGVGHIGESEESLSVRGRVPNRFLFVPRFDFGEELLSHQRSRGPEMPRKLLPPRPRVVAIRLLA
jgi:hypothetical protein